MLTRRENLLRVLRHARPAWIPVTGHCDPYNQPSQEGMDADLREKLKKVFGACNLALTDARVDLCHAAGKFYFHHSCGLIRDLLPLYRRTRMDAVHAYTLPTVGNATIAGGRPVLGDRITMIVSMGMLAEIPWQPDDVRAQIRQMYAEAPGDHIMFGIAGFPHRTMAQNQFVVDCCREFGGLPG